MKFKGGNNYVASFFGTQVPVTKVPFGTSGDRSKENSVAFREESI